jgi:hypothetical protein
MVSFLGCGVVQADVVFCRCWFYPTPLKCDLIMVTIGRYDIFLIVEMP